MDAMFFSVYTPENYYPGRFETKNTFRVVALALDQIKKNEHAIGLALKASDIDRIHKSGKIAAFLDLEGGYDLYGDLNLLRALHRLGLRSMQLTAHNTTNAFIDACNDVYTWGGINDHGRAVIKEMNDLGMVINVAHASNDAIIQTVAASRHPVIYSHGGFYKIVDHPRCIRDEAARPSPPGRRHRHPLRQPLQQPEVLGVAKAEQSRQAAAGSSAQDAEDLRCTDDHGDHRRRRQGACENSSTELRGTIPDGCSDARGPARQGDRLRRTAGWRRSHRLGLRLDGGPELPREIRTSATTRKSPSRCRAWAMTTGESGRSWA